VGDYSFGGERVWVKIGGQAGAGSEHGGGEVLSLVR
jgi:hypothetical protein